MEATVSPQGGGREVRHQRSLFYMWCKSVKPAKLWQCIGIIGLMLVVRRTELFAVIEVELYDSGGAHRRILSAPSTVSLTKHVANANGHLNIFNI